MAKRSPAQAIANPKIVQPSEGIIDFISAYQTDLIVAAESIIRLDAVNHRPL